MSEPEGLDFPKFAKAVYEAMDFEAAGKSAEAAAAWGRAGEYYPGHTLPFTRRARLLLRMAWGGPPPPRPAVAGRGRIMMSGLGRKGRFGNQLLQYGFLKVYAGLHGLEAETPDWIGRDLFALDDPLPGSPLPGLYETAADFSPPLDAPGKTVHANVDLDGYFQGHTSLLAPHRDAWRECFTLSPAARKAVAPALDRVKTPGTTLVAIHLRRGDFVGRFWIAPVAWYLSWLAELWPTLDRPRLYVATEDPSLLELFSAYQPLGCEDIAPDPIHGAEYLVDFEVLRHADVVATSNSSFSVTACMLNRDGGRYFRPEPVEKRLVPFDPWDCEILLPPPEEAAEEIAAVEENYPQIVDRPPSTTEMLIIERFLSGGGTVFSVGGGTGLWVRLVLDSYPHCRMHVFESRLGAFEHLSAHLAHHIRRLELAYTPGLKAGRDRPETLDQYCRETGVRHVRFLNVGDDVDGVALLRGGQGLLAHARIDLVQFPSGGDDPDDSAVLFDLLSGQGYTVYGMEGEAMFPLSQWRPAGRDNGGVCLAVHNRLLGHLIPGRRVLLDVPAILRARGMVLRGVLHVGACRNEEYVAYRNEKAAPILLVDANPRIHSDLVRTVGEAEGVFPVLCAISDHAGQAEVLLASEEGGAYPVTVPQTTLDALLAERYLDAGDFTLLVLDIRGAEMLALRGGEGLLAHVQAVGVKVYFEPRDEGGPCIEAVEAFLEKRGFARIALVSPGEASWGDALYVRAGHL
ncbi:MAG: FkbM family methyltransferase [Alphaproteobacteria bacterium]